MDTADGQQEVGPPNGPHLGLHNRWNLQKKSENAIKWLSNATDHGMLAV